MDDIIIRLVDLPTKVGGTTVLDEAGDYNVYINARQSTAGREKAYKHELDHIKRGDLDRSADILRAEAELKEKGGG